MIRIILRKNIFIWGGCFGIDDIVLYFRVNEAGSRNCMNMETEISSTYIRSQRYSFFLSSLSLRRFFYRYFLINSVSVKTEESCNVFYKAMAY